MTATVVAADKARHLSRTNGDTLWWNKEEQVENRDDIMAAPLLLVKHRATVSHVLISWVAILFYVGEGREE